jgi:hypothetical protein
MSTRRYVMPVEQTRWNVPGGGAETVFTWEYDEGRDKLLALYEKGKDKQWNATQRLDWSLEVPEDNPLGTPEEFVPIYGSRVWDKMDEKMRAATRRHLAAWQFSQFLHGEQGALICTAKIVQCVPSIDAKFYAATQVVDEARHVEVYSRYLNEKINLSYPINNDLKTLLDQVVQDKNWDMTCLGMQIIIEGLALAAFQVVRDMAREPLAKALTAYVMQDEARHVAFGRMALRDYYPQLTESERAFREEFVVDACWLMRDRFQGAEVWQQLGVDVKECLTFVDSSGTMAEFRKMLFMRIVPTLKDIGLFGPKVRKCFEEMGVMHFAELDVAAMSAMDEQVGDLHDAERASQTRDVIESGAAE